MKRNTPTRSYASTICACGPRTMWSHRTFAGPSTPIGVLTDHHTGTLAPTTIGKPVTTINTPRRFPSFTYFLARKRERRLAAHGGTLKSLLDLVRVIVYNASILKG